MILTLILSQVPKLFWSQARIFRHRQSLLQVLAMKLARRANRKVAFDIDYRPNLWALGGHGDGEERFAESAFVSDHLKTILPHCDLIVGTEEEWQIAGGQLDTRML